MNYIKKNYLYSELTAKIIDCAYEVYNSIGFGLSEKIYQRAMAKSLEDHNINYIRECYQGIYFNDELVGKYFLDFLVENKVAIEFKVRNEIYQQDINQLLNYLSSKKLKVGLLLVITKNGIMIKRLINT